MLLFVPRGRAHYFKQTIYFCITIDFFSMFNPISTHRVNKCLVVTHRVERYIGISHTRRAIIFARQIIDDINYYISTYILCQVIFLRLMIQVSYHHHTIVTAAPLSLYCSLSTSYILHENKLCEQSTNSTSD